MTSIALCIAAFILCLVAGRRSVVAGLVAVLGVGYFYGILRANLTGAFAHFTFDAALLGFYLAQWRRPLNRAQRLKAKRLRRWTYFLMAWPLVLFLAPVQDILVELVGL